MKLEMITDGKLWAIKKSRAPLPDRFLSFKNPPYTWYTRSDVDYPECWTDKATCEIWFNRLRA